MHDSGSKLSPVRLWKRIALRKLDSSQDQVQWEWCSLALALYMSSYWGRGLPPPPPNHVRQTAMIFLDRLNSLNLSACPNWLLQFCRDLTNSLRMLSSPPPAQWDLSFRSPRSICNPSHVFHLYILMEAINKQPSNITCRWTANRSPVLITHLSIALARATTMKDFEKG